MQTIAIITQVSNVLEQIKIESPSSCAEEIKEYAQNINQFYHYGSFAILTNTTLGDRETFYSYIAKQWVPKIVTKTVYNL